MASILSHGYKKRALSSVVGTTRYTDEYIVKCEPGVTQKQILDYFRAMKIAPGYLGDSAMVCTDVSASTSVLDGQLWTVTSKYESVSYATGGLGDYSTPLNEPWQVRDGKTTISQIATKCFARWIDQEDTPPSPGTEATVPIVNVVGDPFDPPLMQDIILPTIELSKNLSVSDYTSLTGELLDDTVNAAQITVAGRVIPKWGGKINIEGTTATYVNPANGSIVTYVQARIVVTIHPRTWVRFVLNAGFRYKDATANKVLRIKETDDSRKRTNTPSKLDKDGKVIVDPDPDVAVWIAALTYPAKSWSGANLPSSLSDLD